MAGVDELGDTGTLVVGLGVTADGSTEGGTGELVLVVVEGSPGEGSLFVSPQAKLKTSQGAAAT